MISRRFFLRGLIAAPAIVAARNIMPISSKLIIPEFNPYTQVWINVARAYASIRHDNLYKVGFSMPGNLESFAKIFFAAENTLDIKSKIEESTTHDCGDQNSFHLEIKP